MSKILLDISIESAIIQRFPAGVAHPVERHLAKVEVASSSLVTRSRKETWFSGLFLFEYSAFAVGCLYMAAVPTVHEIFTWAISVECLKFYLTFL